MTQLCSTDEIAALTKHSFDTTEEAAVDLVISMVEAEMQDYVNRPLVPLTTIGERARLDNGVLYLRNSPVSSVTAIRHDVTGTPAYAGSYRIVPGGVELLTPNPSGGFTVFSGDDPQANDWYQVDYVGGLPTTRTGSLRSIVINRVCRIVAKVHDDAMGVSSLTQEGYNSAFLAEGFTEQELALAKRQKRRVIA